MSLLITFKTNSPTFIFIYSIFSLICILIYLIKLPHKLRGSRPLLVCRDLVIIILFILLLLLLMVVSNLLLYNVEESHSFVLFQIVVLAEPLNYLLWVIIFID